MGSKNIVTLMPGEHYVSQEEVIINTVLGSCVSVCLYDPVKAIVGMNHFLLSGRQYTETEKIWLDEAGRYGVQAMELIINGMLKLGANKKQFRAKAFGGASILPARNSHSRFASVGEMNAKFVMDFLKNESIKLVSFDLGGHEGRAIRFYSHDFAVYQRKIKRLVLPQIVKREEQYWKHELKREVQEPEVWYYNPSRETP